MNKLLDVCVEVLALTEEDFADAEEVVRGQLEYSHPFKMATAAWQRELGEHNQAVIQKLRELRAVLEAGKNIQPPKG